VIDVTHLDAQKRIELQHLQSFRDACGDFPTGEIVPEETPDFIVDGGAKRIGIEHTLILVDDGKKRGSVQSRESAKNNITVLAERFFNENNLPEVYVGLFFNSAWTPRKRDQERIAQAVAQTVKNNFPSDGEPVWVYYDLSSGQPIEVDLISIFRTTNFGTEHWQPHEAGEVHRRAIVHIQRSMDRKAAKLTNCLTKCDECWLLLVAPSRTPAGFVHPDDTTLKHTYTSGFHESWMLDEVSGGVVRLNTVPRTGGKI
jgi:hypothetical protein